MILPYYATKTWVGNGSIVRGETVFVKSPTWADGRPLTKTLLGATMVRAMGLQVVSGHVGTPGAGTSTSVPLALGLPLAKTLETIGVTMFGGYTQHGRNEIESGFPRAAIGLVIRFCFEFVLARIEIGSYWIHNYGEHMSYSQMELMYSQKDTLYQIQ